MLYNPNYEKILRGYEMIFEEKTISSQMIYKGKILNLRKDKVESVGGTSQREIIEHNGGAVIAALTGEGKLIMIRQYRKPAGRVMFEVPAGKIDPGEEPEKTAARELKEETGYTAGHIEYVTSFYPTVGYSEEQLHLFAAWDLTPGETSFDENEDIEMEAVDLDVLCEMVMEGRIHDAKTIIAILMVKELVSSGKLPWRMKR